VFSSIAGIFKLKSVGYIVDDLPKTDKIYTDLKFFEQHFKGVMPLEILVDTKKKYGVSRNLGNLVKIDSLSYYISNMPGMTRPLSIAEGLKFSKQAFFEGDSSSFSMPSEYLLPGLAQYLSMRSDSGTPKNSFAKLVSSFVDSSLEQVRISVSRADVGSNKLERVSGSIEQKLDRLFPID